MVLIGCPDNPWQRRSGHYGLRSLGRSESALLSDGLGDGVELGGRIDTRDLGFKPMASALSALIVTRKIGRAQTHDYPSRCPARYDPKLAKSSEYSVCADVEHIEMGGVRFWIM